MNCRWDAHAVPVWTAHGMPLDSPQTANGLPPNWAWDAYGLLVCSLRTAHGLLMS